MRQTDEIAPLAVERYSFPIVGLSTAAGGTGSFQNDSLEVCEFHPHDGIPPEFELSAEGFGVDANGFDDSVIPKACDEFGGFVAVQLDVAEVERASGVDDPAGGQVHEQPNRRYERRQRRHDFGGPLRRDISRGRRMKHHADGIGPGTSGREGVFDMSHPADLDSRSLHDGMLRWVNHSIKFAGCTRQKVRK
jgi:hypothetical protein